MGHKAVQFFVGSICLVLAILAFLYWETPINQTSQFGGTFDRVSEIRFTKLSREGNISPICGCFADHVQESWAGITLARNELTAEFTHDGTDMYAVIVSAAFPGPISPSSSLIFKALVKYKNSSNVERIPPEWIEVGSIFLVTGEPINIRTNRLNPIVSFLPAPYTNTSLSFSDDSVESIKISSKRIADYPLPESYDYYYDFPALDLVGKDIEIFPNPGIVEFQLGVVEGSEQHLREVDFDIGNIESITISVPFSARLAFLTIQNDPSKVRKITDEVPIQEGKGIAISTAGEINIVASGGLGKFQFEVLSKKYDGKNLVHRQTKGGAFQKGEAVMTYRLPIMPPRAGLQIYGSMKELVLRDATGGLTVGANDWPIAGPSLLKFKDVRPILDGGLARSSPVVLNKDESAIFFHAQSRISVNNSLVSASNITVGWLFAFTAAVVPCLAWIIRFFAPVRPAERKRLGADRRQ